MQDIYWGNTGVLDYGAVLCVCNGLQGDLEPRFPSEESPIPLPARHSVP